METRAQEEVSPRGPAWETPGASAKSFSLPIIATEAPSDAAAARHPTALGLLCQPHQWQLDALTDNVIVNLLRQVHWAPLAVKEASMGVAQRWARPRHRAAGTCLLRLSCAFPVFEPGPPPPE